MEAGAKVYFVYNNPDEILCEHVERSREVIQDARIEKINLTTGPMAITGSTRMQATSIQLCVMLTVLEMVARDLLGKDSVSVPQRISGQAGGNARGIEIAGGSCATGETRRAGRIGLSRRPQKSIIFADNLGIDVLTDTTERSPTFCTPPFRKFDDTTAAESWAFLFLPEMETPFAWGNILKRQPRCVEWSETEVRALVGEEKFARTLETIRKISAAELMRFKIGWNDIGSRPLRGGDGAIAVMSTTERSRCFRPAVFSGCNSKLRAGREPKPGSSFLDAVKDLT